MSPLGLALVALIAVMQPDLDCARPAAGQEMIGRLRLSEIEWREDVSRAAMWDAFGRCANVPAAASCRESERQRFEADWAREKAEIQAKYDQMLQDFQARCQATIS